MEREGERIRVAIIGGGCAALSAAFELSRPEHAGRHEITVYQLGFRLGGKGASGRGPADRIEEHGLHLWMGFYENAFAMLRQCYAELDRDPRTCRIADWRDALSPAHFTGVADRSPDGEWSVWRAHLPPMEGSPGDPRSPPTPWSIADYMRRAAALLGTLFESLQRRAAPSGRGGAPDASEPTGAGPTARVDLAQLERWLRYGQLATLGALLEAVAALETLIGSLAEYPENVALRFIDAIARNARVQLDALIATDRELARLWTITDLTLATLRGMLRFRLATDPRGFDAIDDYDCREWLLLNGASAKSVQSGYLKGLYDLGFSYQDGDPARPRIAAGQALRSMLRAFFTYRGAFFWRMNAGMGDVVFAPLYEVLRRRGVRFEFFHRFERLLLCDPAALAPGETPFVEALEFDVQAATRTGAEYEPLVDVRGLPCWPAAPLSDQLVDGDRHLAEARDFESFWDRGHVAQKQLRVGRDFDFVVLGVGLGAVPHVCRDLVDRDPRWRAMVDHVQTVATQAFQIWLSEDMAALGWEEPAINLSGFVEPFDTWADMRHLLDQECFRAPPRALAYFCSVLSDDGPLEPARERVRANAVQFLERDVAKLWPKAARDGGGFRWELLVDPTPAVDPRERAPTGPDRFATQFWSANVNPSDRYALSLPGTLKYRISPLDPSYDNLTIAGDWTSCGFNAGCIEAAVMSGRLAAHALSGAPALADIVGFDHP